MGYELINDIPNSTSDGYKVYDNKAILFMLNRSDQSQNTPIRGADAVGRSFYITDDEKFGALCTNDVDSFRSLSDYLDDFKKNRESEYDDTPIFIQSNCMSLMSFDIRLRLGFKIYLGRWYCDKDEFKDEDRTSAYHLSVLEIKPHMKETDKDIRLAHNISKLAIAHHFDYELFNNKSTEYLDELKRVYTECFESPKFQELSDFLNTKMYQVAMINMDNYQIVGTNKKCDTFMKTRIEYSRF